MYRKHACCKVNAGDKEMTKKGNTVDISSIDKNFVVPGVGEYDLIFTDARNSKIIALEGLKWMPEKGDYRRIPGTFTAENTSAGVITLGWHTAGGAVRFRSDSPVIVLRGKLGPGCDMSHMPRAGSCGFDSYSFSGNGFPRYQKTFQPGPGLVDYKCVIGLNPERKMLSWIVNLPLYGGVNTLEVGVEAGSRLLPPKAHKVKKPILFYGSSITQGGCASRPGNMYPSHLCRKLDAEQINLGFSGNGKGEKAVAEAIASLDLAAFVYDYDYNAPSPEHLQATHEPFFQIIRKAHPHLPVIMISKCNNNIPESDGPRREIIRRTYLNAVEAGDENVYFIDGLTLFGKEDQDACTVDGCHPNDLGFYRMYKTILPVLRRALKNRKK